MPLFSSVSCTFSTVLTPRWHCSGRTRLICSVHGEKFQRRSALINLTSLGSSFEESAEQSPAMESGMDPGLLPPLAWKRRLDTPSFVLKEFRPNLREVIETFGFALRLWKYCKSEREQGRRAPIDPFNRRKTSSSCQGVPLGGIGGGSIGRGFTGNFSKWQLRPAHCEDSIVPADQFSVFVTRGTKKISSVLCSSKPEITSDPTGSGISSWNWNLSGHKSTYHGLFPRAWTTYEGEPDPDLNITCRQVSPFIPHNYKESSFPSSAFIYELANTGDEDASVTLLFTWANSIGESSDSCGGQNNVPFIEEDGVRGVLLQHRKGEHSVTFATAAKQTEDVRVSVCPSFVISGDVAGHQTAKDIWTEISEKETFDENNWTLPCSVSQPGSVIGAAVAATVVVPAQGKKEVTFGLAWDSPEVKFLSGSSYHRRYTRFYGKSGNAASKLVHECILNHKKWESEIAAWQNPILNDDSIPEWYRYTLFNELYYLVAGGTIWTDDDSEPPLANGFDSERTKEISEALLSTIDAFSAGKWSWSFPLTPDDQNVGRFLYLEGVEYLYWNTYDVHFYASYALLATFPKLELQLQREFAASTLLHHPEKVSYLASGDSGIRTVFGAVPHDLGTNDPWITVNSYNIHDTSKWKDLNCKFVIQVYRDAVITGDTAFAHAVWPAVYTAMAYMEQFDKDKDGMIENDGFPDQTYDFWTVEGVSAYCGGLWISALQAASSMADLVGEKRYSKMFHAKAVQAKSVYEKSLWNGSYYRYDTTSNSIHSDQLAGHWYSVASASPLSVVDNAQATTALQTVYDFNVMQFNGGNAGAVNGMLPDGQVDITSMQSREVWTGSTYAVSAAMIHHGMREQGFHTAKGVFLNGWSEQGHGYAFQTPEAWDSQGRYRSVAYMRPLAIWAMQWALRPPKELQQAESLKSIVADDDDGNGNAAAVESFEKLAQRLKELSTPGTESKTYSSMWIYWYDNLRNRFQG